MRPSKFRLPDRTAAATRPPSVTARSIGSGSGPLFPMQVVQPYPTRLNRSRSRSRRRPLASRYRVTTREPGARLVFTQGRTFRPRAEAFRARSPAPTIAEGFEVLVQLVIAART